MIKMFLGTIEKLSQNYFVPGVHIRSPHISISRTMVSWGTTCSDSSLGGKVIGAPKYLSNSQSYVFLKFTSFLKFFWF